MRTIVALFRGINVGGAGRLPMKDLVALLEGIGLVDVRTILQSGNAVFRSEEDDPAGLSDRIRAEIRRSQGFEPQVLLLDPEDLAQAAKANPFPEAESAPETLHLGFLASIPTNPDLPGLERLRATTERFELKGSVFYLHAPDGVGRSRLAAGAERLLGVPMTDRNWRTVCKIIEMAGGAD